MESRISTFHFFVLVHCLLWTHSLHSCYGDFHFAPCVVPVTKMHDSMKGKLSFTGRRLLYYSNSYASFRLLLIRAGDIEINPGPTILQSKDSYSESSATSNLCLTYNRSELMSFNDTRVKLSFDTYNTIKSLGLLAYKIKPTHRGTRAGVKRKNNYNYHVEAGRRNSNDETFTHVRTNTVEKCNVCVINAQSICNKVDLLTDYFIETRVDIAAITETWLSSTDKHRKTIGDITLPGFDFVHVPRSQRSGGGGGVALLYRKTIKRGPVTSHDAVSFESLSCDLQLAQNQSPVKLVVIYRPPYSAKHRITSKTFFREFAEYLSFLSSSSKKLLIVGDFNFHWEIPSDADSTNLRDILDTSNLSQFVCEPTHLNGHTLDLVIARSADDIVDSVHAASYLSDHAVISFTLNSPKPRPMKKVSSYRKLRNIDQNQFSKDLNELFAESPCDKDLEAMVDYFNSSLSAALDKHAPLQKREITVRPRVSPWYTSDIGDAKRLCRFYERRWRLTKSDSDRNAFKEHRLLVTTLTDLAKTSYYTDLISNCETQGQLFKAVEKLLHQKGKGKLPSHSGQSELAERFAQFFDTKIRDIHKSFPSDVDDTSKVHSGSLELPCLETLVPTCGSEVLKVINASPLKTCNLDPVPSCLLAKHLDILLPTICDMINTSLKTGVFPESFKHAVVTPILKSPP